MSENKVDKFITWFFTELDMYGNNIISGIFGDYVVNKIIGTMHKNIDLYVYATDENNNQWKHIEKMFLQHIEKVWNLFDYNKITIRKDGLCYYFTLNNINFRIFCEKPYYRTMFTYQLLQYERQNGIFQLTHMLHNSSDHLYLLKILNHIKRKQLVPVVTKNFILDHNFFIADRLFYSNIIDIACEKTCEFWNFKHNEIKLHTTHDDIFCSICHNEDSELKLKIQCGHVFHKECLKQLILLDPPEKCSGLCPNCRKPIQVFYDK